MHLITLIIITRRITDLESPEINLIHRVPQRRQYLLGLDMLVALERVAALHFFRFSFLPSVLSGESLNNLFRRFDQE